LECLAPSSLLGRDSIATSSCGPEKRISAMPRSIGAAFQNWICRSCLLHAHPTRRGNARHRKNSFQPRWKTNHKTMVNAAAGTTGREAEIAIVKTTEAAVPAEIARGGTAPAVTATHGIGIDPVANRSRSLRHGRSSFLQSPSAPSESPRKRRRRSLRQRRRSPLLPPSPKRRHRGRRSHAPR